MNYDTDKFDRVYALHQAAKRGTELHNFAHEAIRLGQKLPANGKTLSLYVNDAIGYKMTPEVPLFYSWHAYGHADTLSFRRNKLRVHDLKTGLNETSIKQLEGYAGLFCLEYNFNPLHIEIEMRIYQNDEVKIFVADPGDIFQIMETIKYFSARIDEYEKEAMA